ncbi:hypothetical protein [Nannocystis radixulma]|uniref:Uncharacterized protein n=1 Tax=Nannocystis radixulma TaxID=2995305 RepID=A0ABT5B0G1_9BACT|nr:hypothetical protein [Nannocystis radixulma]MDC0667019.1 hypothetical protein [Nannocystis radixulma]
MVDEHLTPVLMACSEAELAVLIEFLGRPPSGLLWFDRRLRDPRSTRAQRVAAVIERILWLGSHSVLGRTGPGKQAYLQIVCDALAEMQLSEEPAEDGLAGLELRMVRYVLDANFEGLPVETQQVLLDQFRAGDTYAEGVRDLGLLHDFLSHTKGPERRALPVGHAAHVATDKLRDAAVQQVQTRLLRAGLKVVLRGAAGPVYNAIRLWGWAGPAFRYTVPVIVYVAYLRGHVVVDAAA